MDPSEVDSSQDIRDGWDSWNYSERVEALNQLANETLDQYGYDDDVVVDTGDTDGAWGNYDDGSITMAPSQIEDPNPEEAIDTVNHETVHAMNDQDGIDDFRAEDGDFDFEEGDLEAFDEHGKVEDVARELDHDGFPPYADGGGGGSTGSADGGGSTGSAGGGESGSSHDDPKSADVLGEPDWSKGVWVESVDESGNHSFGIMYEAPEGW